MRPYALLYLYRRRLRAHAAQELLAGAGVAIAVALVFAVLVANGSIAGSTAQVVRTVVGPASLQLRARSPDGFGEALLARVEQLRGVKQAAPALEQTATIVGPHGSRVTLDVVGSDVSLGTLDGLAHTLPGAVFSSQGVGLTEAVADELGVSAARLKEGAPEVVSMEVRGVSHPLQVSSVLGREAAGALSQTHAAIMPLARLQRVAGLRGRVSRIFVQTQPGHETAVRGELERLAAGHLEVAPADEDVALLRQALHPADQASLFFAVIASLLGFLFAFNAMLLTVPERRQAIADLRIDGAKRTAIIEMVFFQALCLGVAADIVGVGVGYLLSEGAFHQSPGYLAQAFVLGGGTVVGLRPLLLAVAGGILATLLASAVPLLDLRRARAVDAVYLDDGAPGNALSRHAQRRLFAGALALVVPATVLFVLIPSAAIVAVAMLAVATVLAVPLVLVAVIRIATALPARFQAAAVLPVAVTSLRATTVRSLALAATGAVALFGSVALGGARDDLLRGIGRFAHGYSADAAIWIGAPQDLQAVDAFSPNRYAATISRLTGVAAVHTFQGGFLNLGSRRVWIIARPPGAASHVLQSQTVDGNPAAAARLLEGRGWVAVSSKIAEERHLGLGSILTLPTPSGPAHFHIAATTTNLAWSPGGVLMSAADYRHYWNTTLPTALGVDVSRGASVAQVEREIRAALGPASGLEVSSAKARETGINVLTGEGLSQLGEISTLLIIAAILALAAAIASAISQRRVSLSGLRLEGAAPRRLRRILLAESGLMLIAGCLTGVLAGIYGQTVIDAYLKHVTGFPVATIGAEWRPLEVLAAVIVIALAVATIPGWSASRVSPTLALEAEQ
jgi:putative ABC transport system permease protein